MSQGPLEKPLRTFGRLWRRAPAWRLTGLVATLLTLICLLFPPRAPVTEAAVSTLAEASYVAPLTPVPTAAVPMQANTLPPSGTVASPPAHTTPVPVKTASLSLATDRDSQAADGLNDAMAGRRFSGSLRVNGFDVPLPPGEWLQLASGHFDQKTTAGELVMLGRVRNHRLMGYIRISAARSTTEPPVGFRLSPGCDHQNANTNVLVQEALEPFGHQACWTMDHSFLAPLQAWADRANKLPALERAAAGDLAAKDVTFPQDMVGIRFTRAERWGLLEVRYVFNPEEDHIASASVATYTDSDWQPANIDRYPEKVAYAARLRQWAEAFWPKYKAAFDAGQHPSLR